MHLGRIRARDSVQVDGRVELGEPVAGLPREGFAGHVGIERANDLVRLVAVARLREILDAEALDALVGLVWWLNVLRSRPTSMPQYKSRLMSKRHARVYKGDAPSAGARRT